MTRGSPFARSRSGPQPGRPADSLTRVERHFAGRFQALGGPCEVLVDTDDRDEAARALGTAAREARRIEIAFSRYLEDSIVQRINRSAGEPVTVDEETTALLEYAATCHAASGGLFDITSGVLRRVWRFDGSERIPDPAAVAELLPYVGWNHVTWEPPRITLPAGMEIDLGGIGKEYAVDLAAALVAREVRSAFVVNFGGDLFANRAQRGGRPWAVGVDDPGHTGESMIHRIELERGGLATSGDARRFVMRNGRRLGHILDPRTGWPVEDAPRSVTVIAGTCLEAGTLSTIAFLHGARAAEFLAGLGVQFRVA